MIRLILHEHENNVHLPEEVNVDLLRRDLATIWKSRLLENQEDQSKKQQLLRLNDNGTITANNYVGFVRSGNLEIEVRPKIFQKYEFSSSQSIEYLIKWLSYCHSFRFPFSEVNLSRQRMRSLPELMIYTFARYSEKVLREQPYSCYEEVTQDTRWLKGRINVRDYATRLVSKGQWDKFSCTYQPFVFDNTFNRIVKYVCRNLFDQSRSPETRRLLSNILFELDEVSDLPVREQDCDRVKLNRLFNEHEVILQMCRMFLSSMSPAVDQHSKACLGFMVPAERIYEEFVYNYLKRHHRNLFTSVKFQKSDMFLAQAKLGEQSLGNAFQMQHDIYGEGPSFPGGAQIIDAKYQQLDQTASPKFGISQADMYQMATYLTKRGLKEGVIVYPDAGVKDLVYDLGDGMRIKIYSCCPINFTSDWSVSTYGLSLSNEKLEVTGGGKEGTESVSTEKHKTEGSNKLVGQSELLDELIEVADESVHEILYYCRDNNLPLPEVGCEIMGGNRVVAEAELGWPQEKVACLLEYEGGIEKAGWKYFVIDDKLDSIVQLVEIFNSGIKV